MLTDIFNKLFKLRENDTTIQTEVLAGLTAFFTISYIVFLTPSILSSTGMNESAVFTATCLVVGISTLLAAFIANIPITIAPGIALTVYFAYIVVGHHGYSWEDALGMVFISGIIFILLTLTSIRRHLINSIPANMNIAIVVGLSLLIAMVALKDSQIIKVDPKGFIELGNIKSLSSCYVFIGTLLIVTLEHYRIRGSILIVIVFISLFDTVIKHHALPDVFAFPPSLSQTFLKLHLSHIQDISAYKEVFSFFLIALFDATGTFIGLLNQPYFRKKKDINRTIEKGLLADSLGTTIASTLGTSSTSPFIESAAAIEAGGRTGMASLITALLFFLTLFLFPMTQLINHAAIDAVLIYIASCMMREINCLNTQDMTEFLPAFITIVMIPYTFSIADGIGMGLLTYSLLKLLTNKIHQLNPMLGALSLIFLIYFFII